MPLNLDFSDFIAERPRDFVGRELFDNDSGILSLALSPDGHWLACGDAMGRVWIFEWVK